MATPQGGKKKVKALAEDSSQEEDSSSEEISSAVKNLLQVKNEVVEQRVIDNSADNDGNDDLFTPNELEAPAGEMQNELVPEVKNSKVKVEKRQSLFLKKRIEHHAKDDINKDVVGIYMGESLAQDISWEEKSETQREKLEKLNLKELRSIYDQLATTSDNPPDVTSEKRKAGWIEAIGILAPRCKV